ncbi:GNAT family N-acetyltransferase [Pseudomonas mucidolens]|uniref:GNAT family N-acetyltransferase n=1 Tax=Pseudomonas mucidolens TaxID=46679 RepID=UPI0030DD2092
MTTPATPRPFTQQDMDRVLDIWLDASLQAHDFIEPAFWLHHVEDMRNLYIPASQTFVLERESRVVGFCSLHDDQLAALFIAPEYQRSGLGARLLEYAKSLRERLTLAVYTENAAGCGFYQAQGFTVIQQQTDEQTGHLEYLMAWSRT